MKKISVFLFTVVLMLLQTGTYAQLQEELNQAKDKNQAVFLVVTEDGDANRDKALNMANQAKEKVANAVVVELNRSNTSNSSLVKQFGVSTAPVPLLLVLAENGMLAGGFLFAQASADLLVKTVPSPKKAVVMETLRSGKTAFLVVSSKSMTGKSDIVNTCKQACIEMEQNAKIIQIDLDDPKEKDFLASLKFNNNISKPQTFVINSKGQVTGKYTGEVNSQILVATAKKVVKSGGCCPGGSSKGCK
nr:hypothetical protein [Bacteroidota bacterium]